MTADAEEPQLPAPGLHRWIRIRRRRTPIPVWIARALSSALASVEVEGAGNLPPEGAGCIIAFNHPNRYDGLMLFSVIPRRDVATLVTGDMRKLPVRRFLVELAGGVWVEPGGSEDTMQTMLGLAADRWALMLAPEGRTTGERGLARGRRGVGFFALHAGLPVAPVAIHGSAGARALRWPPRRASVTIRIGEPFTLPAEGPASRRERQQLAADAVMCRIAALLPPEQRGVYDAAACAAPERWLASSGGEGDPEGQAPISASAASA